VDNIFYFTEYKNSLIRSLIWQLKFKYSKEIVAILVNCYLEILKKYSFLNNYLFVPVPCSYVNLKKRGFSQSKLLIDGILKKQQLDFIDLLIKRRKIAPQKERSLKSRNNLSGKDFVLDQKYSHKIANKNVLLLDDICTTGQTINACAETLKKYGAKSVSGIVLAQTPKRQDTNLFSINL
jgi:ComF family protein